MTFFLELLINFCYFSNLFDIIFEIILIPCHLEIIEFLYDFIYV